MLLQFDRL